MPRYTASTRSEAIARLPRNLLAIELLRERRARIRQTAHFLIALRRDSGDDEGAESVDGRRDGRHACVTQLLLELLGGRFGLELHGVFGVDLQYELEAAFEVEAEPHFLGRRRERKNSDSRHRGNHQKLPVEVLIHA